MERKDDHHKLMSTTHRVGAPSRNLCTFLDVSGRQGLDWGGSGGAGKWIAGEFLSVTGNTQWIDRIHLP